MAYADDMISAVESDGSAFMQYVTGRGRENYSAYAFVEDSDDTVFYQHVLDDYDGINFIGCGGKNEVISVFEKIKVEKFDDDILFFVDRDTEDLPFRYEGEVLRTKFYSWESHLCQNSFVLRFLQRKITPSLSKNDCDAVAYAWECTINNFSDLIAMHTALVKVSSQLNPSLGMRTISLVKKCDFDGMNVVPNREIILKQFDEKIIEAEGRGIDSKIISLRKEFYSGSNPEFVGKGKVVYQIFKKFAIAVKDAMGRSLIVDSDNIYVVLSSLSSRDESVSYIREYASRRMRGRAS